MKNTDYAGIDYGLGKTNIDSVTGIRYGVIPMNALCDFACDDFEAVYPEQDEEEDNLMWPDPIGFSCTYPNYKAFQSSDDGDIFIESSEYYTYAQFCSPCAPGACYLLNPCEKGAKAYCFGHDWFESGLAPYPVYRVSDNSKVLAEIK